MPPRAKTGMLIIIVKGMSQKETDMKSWERMLLYSLVIFVSAGFLMGAKNRPRGVLAGEELNIVDSKGKTRIRISVGKDEAATLAFLDGQGEIRARLGIGADDASVGLDFFGANGVQRISLGAGSSGAAGLVLSDAQGWKHIDLGVDATGPAGITIFDEKGNPTVKLP